MDGGVITLPLVHGTTPRRCRNTGPLALEYVFAHTPRWPFRIIATLGCPARRGLSTTRRRAPVQPQEAVATGAGFGGPQAQVAGPPCTG